LPRVDPFAVMKPKERPLVLNEAYAPTLVLYRAEPPRKELLFVVVHLPPYVIGLAW
jgi:hypothetical protein